MWIALGVLTVFLLYTKSLPHFWVEQYLILILGVLYYYYSGSEVVNLMTRTQRSSGRGSWRGTELLLAAAEPRRSSGSTTSRRRQRTWRRWMAASSKRCWCCVQKCSSSSQYSLLTRIVLSLFTTPKVWPHPLPSLVIVWCPSLCSTIVWFLRCNFLIKAHAAELFVVVVLYWW